MHFRAPKPIAIALNSTCAQNPNFVHISKKPPPTNFKSPFLISIIVHCIFLDGQSEETGTIYEIQRNLASQISGTPKDLNKIKLHIFTIEQSHRMFPQLESPRKSDLNSKLARTCS